jgi:hypothetical protein
MLLPQTNRRAPKRGKRKVLVVVVLLVVVVVPSPGFVFAVEL